HLRALAKVGVIEEAPGRGDGRERVWQAVHASLEIGNDPQAGPAEVAAEAALVETVLARHDDKVRRYMSTVSTEPREWYEATMVSERSLMLTARELRRLLAQL